MSTQSIEPGTAVLIFGGTALLASVALAKTAASIGGRWPDFARTIATVVALLLWAGSFMRSLHGPFLFDTVLLASIAPLLGWGTGEGVARRAFFLTAAILETSEIALDLGRWRYGLIVGGGAWVALFALQILGPPAAASFAHASVGNRERLAS